MSLFAIILLFLLRIWIQLHLAPCPGAWIIQQLADQSCRLIAKDNRSKADLRKEIKALVDVLWEFGECVYTDNALCVHPHSWANLISNKAPQAMDAAAPTA